MRGQKGNKDSMEEGGTSGSRRPNEDGGIVFREEKTYIGRRGKGVQVREQNNIGRERVL